MLVISAAAFTKTEFVLDAVASYVYWSFLNSGLKFNSFLFAKTSILPSLALLIAVIVYVLFSFPSGEVTVIFITFLPYFNFKTAPADVAFFSTPSALV